MKVNDQEIYICYDPEILEIQIFKELLEPLVIKHLPDIQLSFFEIPNKVTADNNEKASAYGSGPEYDIQAIDKLTKEVSSKSGKTFRLFITRNLPLSVKNQVERFPRGNTGIVINDEAIEKIHRSRSGIKFLEPKKNLREQTTAVVTEILKLLERKYETPFLERDYENLLNSLLNAKQEMIDLKVQISTESKNKDEATPKQGQWKQRNERDGDTDFFQLNYPGLDWEIVGASRIGKLHIQNDGEREDAMKATVINGWYVAVIADGAGSSKYARQGSNLAVESVVRTLEIELAENIYDGNEREIKLLMQKAIVKAHSDIEDAVNKSRQTDVNATRKDFSTTLLLTLYLPNKLLGLVQIGDGLIAGVLDGNKIVELSEPETGAYSSETNFLSRNDYSELVGKVKILVPNKDILAIMMMTDGISDDFIPSVKQLPQLSKAILTRLDSASPKESILEMIDYSKRGSFDDRTILVIYNRSGNPFASPSEPIKTEVIQDK